MFADFEQVFPVDDADIFVHHFNDPFIPEFG
jgi:hypothetical protein